MPHDPHDDQDDIDWTLLTRYLTGELSPAETAAVDRWFAADPRHYELIDELRAVWTASAGDTAGWHTGRAVASLRARALAAGSGAPATRISTPRIATHASRSLLPIAAGIIGLVLAGGWYVRERAAGPTPPPPVATEEREVTTRRGQQAEVRLADGTRVILGPASRLAYAADFNTRDRVVTLHGEAYFVVVHDSAKPFRVRTAAGVAEDLGTAFVVSARASTALQVVVAEGAVVLRANGGDPSVGRRDSLVLRRAQLGRVLSDGALMFRTGVRADSYLAWTRGELAFEDAPLTDVAADLSRWYDVDVRVTDPRLAGLHFTGQFRRNALSEAVHTIAAVTGASVRRDAKGWVFE